MIVIKGWWAFPAFPIAVIPLVYGGSPPWRGLVSGGGFGAEMAAPAFHENVDDVETIGIVAHPRAQQ
ncbi:MAG: hypothetical protein H7251_06015 [Acetobacteraceae bacterium]|nr:hypothetical protein [Acetobacteraceae bacterium]